MLLATRILYVFHKVFVCKKTTGYKTVKTSCTRAGNDAG
ncbi:hypothetical protein DCCM_2131 [Desulfocucumis palustris]|uniref:Uncharacterized protein n=1 Tax=Desulfocucumis palustris TaxID=1898651 RepID=A0A2L2XAN4_9FIRM|nr:hypothetical protein DCCM_2131 [Desulfocucumis palustris]